MIEIHLFGHLRRLAANPSPKSESVVGLPPDQGATLGQVLARLGIDLADVGNVFLNGRLLPRSTYPITLGYPAVAEVPLSPERYLETPVRTGDRLGIFPRNMSAVIV